jgi:hypothetical protein
MPLCNGDRGVFSDVEAWITLALDLPIFGGLRTPRLD